MTMSIRTEGVQALAASSPYIIIIIIIKNCKHCNEAHKTEDCTNVICYNCNEKGHTARNCTKPKGFQRNQRDRNGKPNMPEEESSYEDVSSEEDGEVLSPEYSPIKATTGKEVWSDKKIAKAIENEKLTTLFREKYIEEELGKAKVELSEEKLEEANTITQSMDGGKAVDIYLKNKKKLIEINKSKDIKIEEKVQLSKNGYMWIYSALNKMLKEGIAGRHREQEIRWERNSQRAKRQRVESPA